MEELDLKELFEMFWSRKVYIAVITLIAMVVGIIYSFAFVKPDYKSETSLLLVKQNQNTTESSLTTTDLTLSQKLVSTYSELIKSKSILSTVINNLNMKDISWEQMKKCITVSSVKDTELIKITVTNSDATNAKIIAREIVDVFSEKVKEIYKIDNVNVIDEAEVNETPYNINHIKDIVIFMFVGIVISGAYVFVANMLDTTVKSKDELEKKLGLSVLTEIPLCNINEGNISKKGGKK